MSAHLDNPSELALLPSLPEEAAAHLSRCPQCSEEIAAAREAWAALPATFSTRKPSEVVLERILSSIAPWKRLIEQMASMFDMAKERIQKLVDSWNDATQWETTPFPGVQLMHFQAGPACAGADTGFVRIAPGAELPMHTHLGEELSLILEGSVDLGNGRTARAGEEVRELTGTSHGLRAGEGGCVFAVRLYEGIEINGFRLSTRS
jgi:anti-sigma factor ChrR (cupin superfamily)